LEKAAQLDPRDARLFIQGFGANYQILHRYADAVSAFDHALELEPDLHDAAISSAWTYLLWQGQLDPLRAVLSRLPEGADLGMGLDLTVQKAELLLLERDAAGLLQMLQAADNQGLVGKRSSTPSALYAAWAHRLRGEAAAARAAFDVARVRLDAAIGEHPDDWHVHADHGLALAGLGRRDEALGEARWLQQSTLYHEDAFFGPFLAEARATILAQIGDAEAALDEIQRLLARPSGLSVHTLRLYPLWDPIREHPRFKALLAKYSATTAQ
jgi:serine/threonine-protein kinase